MTMRHKGKKKAIGKAERGGRDPRGVRSVNFKFSVSTTQPVVCWDELCRNNKPARVPWRYNL